MPLVTIDEAARALATANRPILFFDTCSLLDIIRRPLRVDPPETAHRETLLARKLLELGSGAAASLSIVTTAVVFREWNEHPSVIG